MKKKPRLAKKQNAVKSVLRVVLGTHVFVGFWTYDGQPRTSAQLVSNFQIAENTKLSTMHLSLGNFSDSEPNQSSGGSEV